MSATRLAAHGIAVDLPHGWEGRIVVRSMSYADSTPAPVEVVRPVVHLANFALPADRGDFGSGAVDVMGPQHMLLVLFEHGPDSIGTALFRARGMPRPQPHQFRPDTLQRRIPGQLGYQRFFTHADRAFCIYAVLGSARDVPAMAAQAHSVLAATEVAAR
jgi:hypothetical protein